MIVVISSDPQLHRLSREVLADLGQEHALATPDLTLESVGDEDICIVDWTEDAVLENTLRTGGKGVHLYVVDRDKVSSLPAILPAPTVGVLVRPVNRSALRLSLQQAMESARLGPARGFGPNDRDDILQSLLHAYLRLQDHENDRAAFLARVLHDFRAPLTAINGYCGLFLEEALGPLRPKQRDALLRMQRSATRLSRLALSLFELTVHDRVSPETRMAEGTILAAAEQATGEVRATCQERDIAMSVDLEDSPGLFFDSAQIEQVLVNLLENALRFTPRHGAIELRGYPYFWERRNHSGQRVVEERRILVDATPNAYRVDIRDYGPPIANDLLPLLFEEYSSATQTGDRSSGGLGLAICKLIVRAHGGAVWASSGPEGTVFSFVLPLRTATAGAVAPAMVARA